MDASSIATLVICGSLGVVIVLFLAIFHQRARLERGVNRKIDLFNNKVDDYTQRLSLVETHAVDYMNSIGPEGGRLLSELRQTLGQLQDLSELVTDLAETRDLGALEEVRLYFAGQHPNQKELQNYETGQTKIFPLTPDWEQRLEYLLQLVGRGVSQASSQAREAGVPKRSKRDSTMSSLFKAKIRTGGGPYQW